MFSFGMYYAAEYYNQHGVIPPGVLFRQSGTTLIAYNPVNGREMGWNLTNVPASSTSQ